MAEPEPEPDLETGTTSGSEPDSERKTEPASGSLPPSSPSRWDAPADASAPERRGGAPADGDESLPTALRVLVLVAVAGGALYAGLLAIRQEEGEPAPTVRAPRVVETRSVIVEPGPAPRPLRVEAFDALRDLDLAGEAFRFVRSVPEAPAMVCESLSQAGWTPEEWGPSPIGDMSECLAERAYGDGAGASGFAVLRGRETLSEIRFKLNVEDGAARRAAAREVGTLVAGLFDRWRWAGGEALGDRIAALQPFQDVLFGTAVRLMREHGEVERWNLVLRFPTPPPPREATAQERALAAGGRAAERKADGEEP